MPWSPIERTCCLVNLAARACQYGARLACAVRRNAVDANVLMVNVLMNWPKMLRRQAGMDVFGI